MYSKLFRICSFLLVIVLLVNLLPASVLAEELQAAQTEKLQAVQQESTKTQIVEEVTKNRTQYSKEFMLSSGMHMAVLYPEAVHFEKDGQWEEIDNTLKAAVSTKGSSYTNTAGVWQVTFPQSMTKESAVTITKDGYTLSFFMNGQLQNAISAEKEAVSRAAAPSYTLQAAKTATAKIEKIDLSAAKESATHPETVPDKLYSRLQYTGVYENTNVVYDLSSNRVKESIVMARYNAQLRGYQYTLQTGTMIPVVREDGSIDLYDEKQETVIMVMPAPFLVDSANEYSYDVAVSLTGGNGTYTLTYQLPQSWLAAQERQWPVILDPVVTANLAISNIKDASVYQYNAWDNYTNGVLDCGHTEEHGIMRSYLKYRNLPTLKSSDVVLGAYLRLLYANPSGYASPIEVRKTNGNWESETITWANQPGYQDTIEDYAIVQNQGHYGWNITEIVRDWYATGNTGLVLRAPDEIENDTTTTPYLKQFFSSDYTDNNAYKPYLEIYFRNNNGLESYWDYTTASAGRAGTSYVNNYTGNLVWVHSDLGFGGNRMPVSINHVHNANDAGENSFGLGYGWRTNYNQKVHLWSENNNYYVWEDSDGTDHYFLYDEEDQDYKDEDGLELTLTTTGSGDTTYCIKDKKDNCSYFDASGRLTKLENNQQTKSSITITYVTGTDKIATVTDGVGRVYHFDYPNGLLSRISYKGKGTDELDFVAYSYTGEQLTEITYKDNEKTTFTYNSANLITCAKDIDDYKIEYTYNSPQQSHQPYRVLSVQEKDGDAEGSRISIAYANNQTTFTDHNNNVEIMQFNNWGNTTSVQDGLGRAQFAQYSFNARGDDDNNTDPTKKGNQLTRSSKLQNTVVNLLPNSSFEGTGTWSNSDAGISNSIHACTVAADGTAAYMGVKALKVTGNGYVYHNNWPVVPGESLTFSAYVYVSPESMNITAMPGAQIALYASGKEVASERMSETSGWQRVEVTFTNTLTQTQWVAPRLYIGGIVYMDCVQLEQYSAASRYNLVDDGDFSGLIGSGWTATATKGYDGTVIGEMAIPTLESTVMKVTGVVSEARHVYQQIPVIGSAGDSFVLAGWAKADAVPFMEGSDREFALQLTFNCTDNTTQTEKVRFNPDAGDVWQYAAAPAVADKAYSSVTVTLAYDYNVGEAWFDGIQLFKEEFGSSYTYDEDGNVVSVRDLQQKETTYEYASNNLTKVIQDNKAKLTYTYDTWDNVQTATTEEGIVYTFTYDTYGNNTAVAVTGGGMSMTSSATYTTDGNYIATETDTLGNTTEYTYNTNTGVLESDRGPGRDVYTQNSYYYDSMNRLIQAYCPAGLDANIANYTYTDDLLTQLSTNSTTYTFTYGDFDLRSSVKIGTRTLASYKYTNDQDRRLARLDYGNDDHVNYTYDNYGRLTAETYEDGEKVTYFYDNDGALARTVDSGSGKETAWLYDMTGRLVKYSEKSYQSSYSITYEYNAHNNVAKTVEKKGSQQVTTTYDYDEDQRVTAAHITSEDASTIGMPGHQATVYHVLYIYDALGRMQEQRIVSDSAYTPGGENNGVVEYAYSYAGTTTSTSSQISQMELGGAYLDETFSYTYNAEGYISSATEGLSSQAGTDTYSYDSLGELEYEYDTTAGKMWHRVYDGAGNTQTRSEYALTESGAQGALLKTDNFTYGENQWRDLLTAYNGTPITYDEIGNRLSDGTWTYTWEHGRELATMTKNNSSSSWDFSYDANGLRTQRTDYNHYNYYYGAYEHYEYQYDSSGRLIYMDHMGDTMYFSYDPVTGFPQTMIRSGMVFYYVTNSRGDVMAILDDSGNYCAVYEYDAWGNVLYASDCNDWIIAEYNPLLYRGYVYDWETGLYYLQSRYYDPEIGRFINADAFAATGQGLIGNNMFAYCGNNPVNMADTTGNLPFFLLTAAIGAVAGAIIGGVTAAKNGGNIWAGIGVGAAVGGLAGAGFGAAAGVILAGSAVATTTAVITGAGALASTVSSAGAVAGLKLIADNISQACNNAPHVFWSGGEIAKNAAEQVANDVGGTTLEMTRLGTYLESIDASYQAWQAASLNFANVAKSSGCAIYSIQNAAGVTLQSTWATIEYQVLKTCDIIYGVVMQNGSIQIMP